MRKSAEREPGGREDGIVDDAPSWVFDTNVVVSGLLSALGPPGRLVDMVLARQLRMTLDGRIETEYREVLSRPKFEINSERLEAFLAILQFQDWVIAMPWKSAPPPDKGDTMFLEVANETAQRILITGNTKHFPKTCHSRVSVLSPQEAWSKFAALRGSL
jgi:putative PIN family toxin of toxin-antitoxin system